MKYVYDLLTATLDMDSKAVAEKIEKIHMQFASTIQYNDENSLSSVLTIAYLSSMQYYFLPIREMPALLVELKWNQKAGTALQQIRETNGENGG